MVNVLVAVSSDDWLPLSLLAAGGVRVFVRRWRRNGARWRAAVRHEAIAVARRNLLRPTSPACSEELRTPAWSAPNPRQ